MSVYFQRFYEFLKPAFFVGGGRATLPFLYDYQ
jgi:hypothetical protein